MSRLGLIHALAPEHENFSPFPVNSDFKQLTFITGFQQQSSSSSSVVPVVINILLGS
jgi:hypothetical protein